MCRGLLCPHPLQEKVQDLMKKNADMVKNMQAMQVTQVHGERGHNFLNPKGKHSGQDKGEKEDSEEGNQGKVARARSRAEASKARGKKLAEEEPESKDEFDELHQRIDVLQNQVLETAKNDGIDEESLGYE